MPIYEYLCDKCGEKFELLKSKMVKQSREKCPSCGGTARQQLSSFGVGSSKDSSPACREVCPKGDSCGCGSGSCPFSGGM